MSASEQWELRERKGTYTRSRVPMVILISGAAAAAALLLGANPATAIIALLALPLILAGLVESSWLITGLIVLTAMVPVEMTINDFLGYHIRNPLQFAMPIVFLICLLRGLRTRELPKLMPADVLLLTFGLWGLLSLLNAGDLVDIPGWKKYGNKIIYPIGFYFIVRMVPFDHHTLLRLIKVCAICVAVQSLLMVIQARAGESVLYSTHGGFATGPFVHFWTAATYLVMWFPLFLYLGAVSRSPWWRGLSLFGLMLNAYAVTRTGQRAATALLPALVGLCLVSPRLRRTAGTAVVLGALLYVPWSMSGAGGALLSRFDQTDESRAAYRAVAFELLRSPRWDPIFGIGPWHTRAEMTRLDTDELADREFMMWGTRQRSLSEVAEDGSALHNVFIALLLEFGAVGALLGLAIMLVLARTALRIARSPENDHALLTAIIAALAAFAGRGLVHNVYSYTAPMCLVFFWYGVIVGHPQAFGPDGRTAFRSSRD